MKQIKERKIIVNKMDYYDDHFKDSCTHYSPRTKAETEKLKKRLEEKEKDEVKRRNDTGLRNLKINERIVFKLTLLMDELINDTRQHTRNNREIKAEMCSEFRRELKNILEESEKFIDERR